MIQIVLHEPEIPFNTGAIGRSCVATDSPLHLIEPLGFVLNDKYVKRAGMDYMIGFKIIRYKNLDEFYLDHEKDLIFYITRYSSSLYSKRDYSDVAKDYYFMFGRESTGIPHDVLRKHYENTLRIPMAIDARSLNLSNCVAIILSEACRQQNFFSLSTSETIKGSEFLFNENKK